MSPLRARPRCLVIHPGALGDVLLALPALAHLGALGFTRTLAAAPRLASLLTTSGHVESVVDLDGLGLHRLFADEPAVGPAPPLARFDAVVSWLGAGDPAYVTRLRDLGCPVVIAHARPPAGARGHVSRHLLDSLGPLGPAPVGLPPARLRVPPDGRAWAGEWLEARGLALGETVVVHPGAGSPRKAWPGFGDLIRRLVAAGWPVVVTAGPADGSALAALRAVDALHGAELAADLPLPRLAGLLGAAGAFVGNDSGPTHLAAAVGCPTVALFGPTDPLVWAPPGPHVRVAAGAGPAGGGPWAGVTAERVVALLGAAAGPAAAGPAGVLAARGGTAGG